MVTISVTVKIVIYDNCQPLLHSIIAPTIGGAMPAEMPPAAFISPECAPAFTYSLSLYDITLNTIVIVPCIMIRYIQTIISDKTTLTLNKKIIKKLKKQASDKYTKPTTTKLGNFSQCLIENTGPTTVAIGAITEIKIAMLSSILKFSVSILGIQFNVP